MIRRLGIRILAAATALVLLIVACRDITAPERSQKLSGTAKSLLNPSGLVVVHPDSMRGWVFYNDQTNAACPTGSACRMVQGPATPALGAGSAELYDSLSTDGKALILADYAGTRFDQIADLNYATYRQTVNAGNNLAISLQFNVDYDLNDAAVGYQGRLVFEPYVGIGGNVPQNTWQTWEPKAGKWWGTKSTVTRNGASVANPCVQATPCTWAAVLASFANVGVHSLYGAVVLKAGSGWPGFRGNVDKFTISVAGVATTFDFELTAPSPVPATPPDSLPEAYETLTDIISGGHHWDGELLRDIVVLQFKPQTITANKQAAISMIGGTVVGGRPASFGDGIYLVQVPGDGTVEPLFAAIGRLRQLPQVALAMPEQVFTGFTTYRTSADGNDAQSGAWRLNPDSAFGNTDRGRWALEAVNAPFAWGCSTGGSTRVGVLDMDLHKEGEIVENVDTTFNTRTAHTDNHGTWMASLIAARANDHAGITGVMWNARVSMADISQFTRDGQPVLHPNGRRKSDGSKALSMLQELAHHGARVINLSVGSDSARTGPHTPAQDSARAGWGFAIKDASEYRPFGALRPLWVLSAGNMQNATDQYWNTLGGAVDFLPRETLVVTGASSQRDQLLPAASGTGAISLAAPGDRVAVSDANGTWTVSGSSPATALVSGAAGLLFAFDSTITADSAAAWLVRAAVRSGRVAGSYPLLDAYGALRIAAQQPGAPLCGNRVWLNNVGLIMAERDSSMPAGESLVATPLQDWESNYVNTYHGGHRVDLAEYRQFNYSDVSRHFVEVPFTRPSSGDLIGGTYRSSREHANHDGTLGISFRIDGSGANTIVSASVLDITNGYRIVASSDTVIAQDVPNTVCVRQSPQFTADSIFTGYADCDPDSMQRDGTFRELARYQEAMAPQGGVAIIALNFNSTTVGHDLSWGPCAGADSVVRGYPRHCRATTNFRSTSAYYQLLRVNLVTREWDYLPVDSFGGTMGAGLVVSWLSIGERGDEIVLEVGAIDNDRFGSYTCSNAATVFTALPGARDQHGGAIPAGSATRTEAIDAARWCDGVFDPSGTIAPLRAPFVRSTVRP